MQNTITEKEKEAKRKQQTTSAMEAIYKANLDGLVSKLNEYSKVVDMVRALKLKVMENAQFNVAFDGHLEPMLKSIGYVNGVAEEIKESLAHIREIANSIQYSAKESQQSLLKDTTTKELSIPEWVLEMSDDLDELKQREFIVAEKLAKAETKMDKIAKLLKDGKTQVYQRNQLTPEQQQKLENDSKTMLIFVQKLSERIAILRQQIRALRSNQKLIQAKKEYRFSGENSLLNDSDLDALDTSGQNTSALASELIASISLIDDNEKMKPPKQNGIPKLLKHLDASSNRTPKVVNIVPINIFVSTHKPKEDSSQSIILKPKVAEAQKSLIENLLKVRSPRASIISDLPTSQPRQPFSLFGNKPASTTVPQPTVSTPTQQKKGVFGSGNITTPVTPSSIAASYCNALTTGRPQPLTSTPKPMLDASTTNGAKPTAFTPQQSTLPFFGSPLNSTVPSPLTFNPKITDNNVSDAAVTKESEEEQKRITELEEDIKKEAEKEAEAKKKAAEVEAAAEAEKKKKEAEQEKAKKEAEEKEEQERLKKLAQEEEEKRKAELEEAEVKAKAEKESQRQAAAAAEEEVKKKQEAAAAITSAPTGTVAAPISFSFKPVTPPSAALTVPVLIATSQARVNFSFKPAAAPAPTVVRSESSTDIGIEDDGIESALAGTTISSPPSSNGFGKSGFSSFGGSSAFGKQTTALNNPFGGGFSSTATTTTNNASTFGGTPVFGSFVKNPFGGCISSTIGSEFGGGSFSSLGNKPSAFGSAFSQQQPIQTTPQKNPFGSGTSAFSQNTKSPFASPTTSTGNGLSSFGNKPTAFGQQASTSTFGGGSSSFGGGSSAFGSNSSPFSSAASGSAFGGTSAFGQPTKSPFSSAAASNNATTSAFGGGFSAFGNKAGGFGALAQQANTSSNIPQNTNSAFGLTSAFGGNSVFGPRRQ